MIPYKNLWWDSWIVAYELWEDYIKVKFKRWRWTLYTYSYWSTGSSTIENMKQLAECWEWLHSYIWKNKPNFSNKV